VTQNGPFLSGFTPEVTRVATVHVPKIIPTHRDGDRDAVLKTAGHDAPYAVTELTGILSVALKIASYPAIVIAYVWAKDGVDPKVIGML
jgi:hypothetical protein